MKSLMKTALRRTLTLLLPCTLAFAYSPENHAATATFSTTGSTISCPSGFAPIPSGLACAAINITTTATADIPPPQDCPTGFERVPGVRFCVAKNLTIEIKNNVMLIAKKVNLGCPVGFSQAPGTTICTANNLMLKEVDHEVKLFAYETQCSRGFFKPEGARFCMELSSSGELAPPVNDCPPGFIRPPGVHFCVANNLLFADPNRRNAPPPPVGICPEGWVKPDGVNFCVPTTITTLCGADCGSGEFTAIKTSKNYLPEGQQCPAGTTVVWFDMPVYDEQGLFVVDFKPTQLCVNLPAMPAG